MRGFSSKMRQTQITQNSHGRLCASLRSRNAHGQVTRAILCENLQDKMPEARWSNLIKHRPLPLPYPYHKKCGHTVWGKKYKPSAPSGWQSPHQTFISFGDFEAISSFLLQVKSRKVWTKPPTQPEPVLLQQFLSGATWDQQPATLCCFFSMLTIVAPSVAALTLPITAIGSIGISSPVLRSIAWMRFTGFNGDNYMAILRENVHSTTNGKN